MLEAAEILCLSFFLDLLIGDPHYRLHPVRIMGRLISFIEQKLRSLSLEGKAGGVLLALIVAGVTIAVYLSAHLLFNGICRIASLGLDLFLCYSALALKDLIHCVQPVRLALKHDDIHNARKFVGMIVGRDVECLGQPGLARAAIETLSENFVDGFLSPVFWFFIGAGAACLLDCPSLPAAVASMLLFKVVSTLDSMVGYKNLRFRRLGWASARLDDIMNFIPARFSLLILFLGACLSGIHPRDGLSVAMRDRLKHASPNSVHAESFFAGALHCRLGGPVFYMGKLHEYEWLGEEYPDPSPSKISTAIRLTTFSAVIATALALTSLILMS